MLTIQDLQSFVEHAPPSSGYHADDLLGWWCAVEGGEAYVCVKCAGRIHARGCNLGTASPVWADEPAPTGVCVCCEGGEA